MNYNNYNNNIIKATVRVAMAEYTDRFESVNILGIQVTSEPLGEVLAAIGKVLGEDERKGRYVCGRVRCCAP